MTSSWVNGVVHFRDHQDRHCQDDHRQVHQDHQDHFLDGHRQVRQSHHRCGLLQDHPDGLVHHSDDQHQDLQDDHRGYLDHQVRACQDQKDALARLYLQDRDPTHLPEFDPFEHLRQDLQGDHPSEDDPRQVRFQNDSVEEELDDYFLEVAESDDQTVPYEVVAEDEVWMALGLQMPQAQHLLKDSEQQHRFVASAHQVTLQQLQVLPCSLVVQM